MEQQIRFCTTSDGVRIAYATVGQGPPLVRIPGWVSHLEVEWENPLRRGGVEFFAQHLLHVRYDKRGTGLSDRNVSDFSIDSRVRDLEAVVDHLEFRRVALMGLSEGGPVAIAYAARHPRRVSRLVLYGTFASNPVQDTEAFEAIVALVRAQWGLGSATLSDLFMPGASAEERGNFMRIQKEGATAADAAAMLRANVEVDVRDFLPQVKAPTLVVHVTGDLVVPFEKGREIAGGIPKARLLPVEGDRHIPAEETYAQVGKATLDFLLEEGQERAAETAAPSRDESGPVTVLFTDVEGSTALTQRLGDAKSREVLRTHERTVREALKDHGGSEVKTMGDGFMAHFSSASRALECAIAMQRAFAEDNESTDEPVQVRIGLNAGEPIAEDDDLFGTAVIVAARIAAKAQGGEILASDVVRQLVAGKDFLFADLGDTAPARLRGPGARLRGQVAVSVS